MNSTLPQLINALAVLTVLLLSTGAIGQLDRNAVQGERLTIWLLFTGFVLADQWMRVAIPGGLEVHYLGAPFLALTLGYPRALLSMVFAITVSGEWTTLGIDLLVNAVLPVWLMTRLLYLSQRVLPANLFVYLLGLGFFGLYLVMGVQNIAHTALLSMLGIAGNQAGLTLGYGLLLAAGEAILEGMLLTVLVVYLPRMVETFDDNTYLQARRML